MRDERDIQGNHFGRRFLSPEQFWQYAHNLQLVDSPSFRKELLEFLERKRLLVPICRIRYPPKVVRVWYANEHPYWADPTLPAEANEKRVEAATNLYRTVRRWASPRPDRGLQFHPLDLVDPSHLEFVESDVASHPFQPWQEFEVTAGKSSGHSMKTSAVATYYRYWQVFRLAEILSMAMPMLVNFGDKETSRLLSQQRLAEIPADKIYQLPSNLLGWHALREFAQHEPAFEAMAFLRAYRDRALREATKDQLGSIFRLTGKKLDEFREMEMAIAHHAAWRWNQTEAALLEFIKWQCQRWDRWAKAGQHRLCEDYERNISETVWLYRLIASVEYADVVQAVGRVTGHFRQTLDVIFPDWFQEQRELADRALKDLIKRTMDPFKPLEHDLSAADLDEFLDWIFAEGFLQIPLFFARLVEVGRTDDRVAPTVLAKEAEGLGVTIEHLMNAIGAKATNPEMKASYPVKTLWPKLQWLWDDMHIVRASLKTGGPNALGHLTNTKPGFAQQKNEIAKILPGDPYQPIVQQLLLAGLVRNQGTHLSLVGFDREEIHELIEVLLRTILLNWKHARRRGLI